MNAVHIVDALLEGKPRTKPRGQSAEPLIQAWINSCEGDEVAFQKMKPRLVRAACICARAVLPKVPAKHKQVCLAAIEAIEAAEAWLVDPSEANRLRAEKAGDVPWSTMAGDAVKAAAWTADAAGDDGTDATRVAYWAYEADPNINFPALIAAKMAEYPVIEGLRL